MSSQQNPDLLAVSQQINDAMAALQARKNATEDPNEFRAFNASLRELNQRLQSVNGLIFAERSQAISEAAEQVEGAQQELAEAIRDVEQLNTVLQSINGFIGLVDRVIAVAAKGAV